MMAIHTYPRPKDPSAPYAAFSEDVRQGKILVGDIVVFDWEDGARNVVRATSVDGGFWLADETVPPIASDEADLAYRKLREQMKNQSP